MVTGWRRAFCTSIPKEKVPKVVSTEKQNTNTNTTNNNSPKPSSKFGFFSNPSTPRQQSSSSSLRCKSASATAVATPESSVPNSPRLQCKVSAPHKNTNKSTPRLLTLSTPSPPISPSSFSLLKNTLRLTKVSKCGICMQSVKTGQGKAIFTAECSHAFHFPCVASHANNHQILVCPLCNTVWKDIPIIPNTKKKIEETKNPKTLRVYNDDEPLMSPVSGFNPIPETDEFDVEDDGKSEFQGFFVKPNQELDNSRRVDVKLHPEVALLASTRSYQTYAVVLKIRAPLRDSARLRAPLDVATLIDVSSRVDETKLQMMKRAMRLVISSLNSKDRLSIVVLSSVSKRVLPLKRMTPTGRRTACRIVDALACSGRRGVMMSVHDALKKTAKVLEDRREKNPVSTIMILSDGREKGVFSTRYSDIPVNVIEFGDLHAPPPEEAIEKCLRGMLSVVVQDLKIQVRVMSGSGAVEILAVYSSTGHSILQSHGLVRVGDLYIEEERDLLVEIRSSNGAQHVLSVQSSYVDPSTREFVYAKEQGLLIPKPQAVRSSTPGIERLRNLHVVTRAIAESRRLLEHGDLSGAQHLLSSARALLLKSSSKASNEFVKGLEAELAEVQKRRQAALSSRRPNVRATTTEDKAEPLTPTSAWRAAERLAKLAVMRKSMNRVSDLHGFENAGF